MTWVRVPWESVTTAFFRPLPESRKVMPRTFCLPTRLTSWSRSIRGFWNSPTVRRNQAAPPSTRTAATPMIIHLFGFTTDLPARIGAGRRAHARSSGVRRGLSIKALQSLFKQNRPPASLWAGLHRTCSPVRSVPIPWESVPLQCYGCLSAGFPVGCGQQSLTFHNRMASK